MMPDIAAMMHRHERGDDGDAAAHAAKPEIEAVVHLLGDAGPLEKRRHEDKERHRYQDIFREIRSKIFCVRI